MPGHAPAPGHRLQGVRRPRRHPFPGQILRPDPGPPRGLLPAGAVPASERRRNVRHRAGGRGQRPGPGGAGAAGDGKALSPHESDGAAGGV